MRQFAYLLACLLTANAAAASWTAVDVGAVGVPGSYSDEVGEIVITGSGADIWGTVDAFHYAYQPLDGDGVITAQVFSIDNTHAWAKAGVMIRASLAADATHAAAVVTPGNGVSFQRRNSAGDRSYSTTLAGFTAPHWVRLTRAGGTFTAYHSADGNAWVQIGSQIIAMPARVLIGLVVTSHDNSVATRASFTNVTATTVTSGGGKVRELWSFAWDAPADARVTHYRFFWEVAASSGEIRVDGRQTTTLRDVLIPASLPGNGTAWVVACSDQTSQCSPPKDNIITIDRQPPEAPGTPMFSR